MMLSIIFFMEVDGTNNVSDFHKKNQIPLTTLTLLTILVLN